MTPARSATATHASVRRVRPTPRRSAASSRSQTRAESGMVHIAGRQLSVSTLLLVDVALLCVIGLVMVGTASSVISIATYGSPWAILIREGMWMAIGAAALGLALRVDYRKLRRFSPLILLGTFGLLLVVLVPGVGVHAHGLQPLGRVRRVPVAAVRVDEARARRCSPLTSSRAGSTRTPAIGGSSVPCSS